MKDLAKLFGAVITGPGQKVDRTEVGGLTVSTVHTSDFGYETALLDAVGAHPVERYESLKQAKAGHTKWVEWAGDPSNNRVTKLGYGSLVDAETINLKREVVQ